MPVAMQQEGPVSFEQLTPQNFGRLSELIQSYSGIKMPPSKRTMLEGRLRRLTRAARRQSVNDYCRYLFEQNGLNMDLVELIDAVTTNKTEFFREPAHFGFLAEVALPALIARGQRRLKAWSAACSTGAEPYTIAMVLSEGLAAQRGIDYQILATDLSTAVLRDAIGGRFDAAMIEPVPIELRRRYVRRAKDPSSREIRIAPELRSKVFFGRLNLMDQSYPIDQDMDLIFCRNVLIYFDKQTQAQVLRRLCDHLRPGGFLFLGHSESINGIDLPLTTVANTVFQRR